MHEKEEIKGRMDLCNDRYLFWFILLIIPLYHQVAGYCSKITEVLVWTDFLDPKSRSPIHLANRQFVFSVYFTQSLYMKLISGIFVQGMVYHPQGEIKHSLVSTDKTWGSRPTLLHVKFLRLNARCPVVLLYRKPL